jgi:hypothetical protein
MNRITLFTGTARIALSGLLLGASSIVSAQEVAPAVEPVIAPVVVTDVPAPVASPKVTPAPEAQSTDSIAPSALGDIAIERAQQRTAARERAAVTRSPRTPAAVSTPMAAPTANAEVAPVAPIATDTNDTAIGAGVLDVEPVAQAPIQNSVAQTPEPVGEGINDWLLIAGVVGAAGLAGAAALAASRRRRRIGTKAVDYTPTETLSNVTPDTKTWAAMPASKPVTERQPAPVAAPQTIVQPVQAAPSFDPVFAAQPSMPISADPLFAERTTSDIPVTDPLFARKVELPPVTDPMFAHLAEYEGDRANEKAWAFDARRDWADSRKAGDHPVRTLEPAE